MRICSACLRRGIESRVMPAPQGDLPRRLRHPGTLQGRLFLPHQAHILLRHLLPPSSGFAIVLLAQVVAQPYHLAGGGGREGNSWL